ncbi:MAG: hypothetical protein BWZ09_02743 [Alphaproteobacteria bacterium ADurb.BinA305]|nr:MAG: hypothetical protein BWZ09_02743 [Alphaproteobacteria bacterium ADurb.BinA305]
MPALTRDHHLPARGTVSEACTHPSPEIGEAFDYCPDCGATRDKPKSRDGRRRHGDWHTCKLCLLRSGDEEPCGQADIRDRNGNTVGAWAVLP